jgi:phosphate acetyltransferase
MAGKHQKYQRLLDFCTTLPPTPTAVAHPCDVSSLDGAVAAARMGLIIPILVGPRARLEAIAKECGLDLTGLSIEETAHSHESAARAVELVRAGKAQALMKGSLHTDELMSEVVKRDGGLRTARRVSHCFIMDVPTHAEPLIITDAAVNIAPTLEEKVDIIQNAIELAHALRFKDVRVAVLSAVETVNPKLPSTIEAAALCKMADRKQITGAILDGPLALDNAISLESVAIKNIDSPVGARQRAGGAGPRSRQHPREEPVLSRGRRCRGDCARCTRAGHPHEPRGFSDDAAGLVRGRRAGGGGEARRGH